MLFAHNKHHHNTRASGLMFALFLLAVCLSQPVMAQEAEQELGFFEESWSRLTTSFVSIRDWWDAAMKRAVLADEEATRTVQNNMRERRDENLKRAIQNSPEAREVIAEQMRDNALRNAVRQAAQENGAVRSQIEQAMRERYANTTSGGSTGAGNTATSGNTSASSSNTSSNTTTGSNAGGSATPAYSGTARLKWRIPTKRENGTNLALTEIDAYEIYLTAEKTGSSKTIKINNRSQTEYVVGSLAPDTYHFSMVTIDVNGVYSELSQVVSKTITQ